MKKKLLLFTFFLMLQNCGFSPIYSEYKNKNYKFEVIELTGSDEINNFVNIQIKNYSNSFSENILRMKIKTNYEKEILSKNTAGKATNYLITKKIEFTILGNEKNQNFSFSEQTKTTNIENKFDFENYEKSIKNNFVSSSIEKLILKITTNQ